MADENDKGGAHEGSRIKVDDLPQPQHELSEDEQKGVQGGAMRSNTIGGAAGDDRLTTQARQNTIGGAAGDDEVI